MTDTARERLSYVAVISAAILAGIGFDPAVAAYFMAFAAWRRP